MFDSNLRGPEYSLCSVLYCTVQFESNVMCILWECPSDRRWAARWSQAAASVRGWRSEARARRTRTTRTRWTELAAEWTPLPRSTAAASRAVPRAESCTLWTSRRLRGVQPTRRSIAPTVESIRTQKFECSENFTAQIHYTRLLFCFIWLSRFKQMRKISDKYWPQNLEKSLDENQ